MHPQYTQRDMRALEVQFQQDFLRHYEDPLAAFIDHHAIRLGYALPAELEYVHEQGYQYLYHTGRMCEDCEQAAADIYCPECQGGLALCSGCSALLHAGASRRRHQLRGVDQAPTVGGKPYVPRQYKAFLAPFSIILAMYRAMRNDGRLSLTEAEIKSRAQPFTDTDLYDKQPGIVKKEAAREPTFALSSSGQRLGERLEVFSGAFHQYMDICRMPKVSSMVRQCPLPGRRLVLIVDDNERDRARLTQFAAGKNLPVQSRLLPAGDYVWILTSSQGSEADTSNELVLFNLTVLVLPVMQAGSETVLKGSGLRCFYLVEGSIASLRNCNQQGRLKTAQWLMWFSKIVADSFSQREFMNQCISYKEYASCVARNRQAANENTAFRNSAKQAHVWHAQNFVDNIIRDGQEDRPFKEALQVDLGLEKRGLTHLLVIQGLEQYNKRRQSTLNKCCETVNERPGSADDIVLENVGQAIHTMVHYDVTSYWQLYMQVTCGIFIVRTENAGDTEGIQQAFLNIDSMVQPLAQQAELGKFRANHIGKPRQKMTPHVTVKAPVGQYHTADEPIIMNRKQPSDQPDVYQPRITTRICNGNDRTNFRQTPGGAKHVDDGTRRKPVTSSIKNDSLYPSCFEPVGIPDPQADSVINYGVERRSLSSGVTKSDDVQIPDVQPFAGQGYCLGSGLSTARFVSNGLGVTPKTGKGGMATRQTRNDTCKAGTCGAEINMMVDNQENVQSPGNGLSEKDFIDSQNEDLIMSQVIAQSAKEDFPMTTEDEMLKLALEISRQNTGLKDSTVAKQQLGVHRPILASPGLNIGTTSGVCGVERTDFVTDRPKISMHNSTESCGIENSRIAKQELNDLNFTGDRGEDLIGNLTKLTEEEQLQLAIEKSKIECHGNTIVGHDLSERDFSREVDGDVFDKEQNFAFGLNKGIRKGPVGSNDEIDDKDDKLNKIHVEEDEEEQMKLAMELSKQDTNKNSFDKPEDEHDLEFALKDSEVQNEKNRAKRDIFKKQIELAIYNSRKYDGITHEADKTHLGKRVHTIEKIPDSDKNLGSEENEAKQLHEAIKRSRIEHSPMKKMKIDGQDIHLSEEDMVKLAINKSILECTPKKKTVCELKGNVKEKQDDAIHVIQIDSQSQEFGYSQSDVILENDEGVCILSQETNQNCTYDEVLTDVDEMSDADEEFIPPSPESGKRKPISFSSLSNISGRTSMMQRSAGSSAESHPESTAERKKLSTESEQSGSPAKHNGWDESRWSHVNKDNSLNKTSDEDFSLKKSLFLDSDKESDNESEEDIFAAENSFSDQDNRKNEKGGEETEKKNEYKSNDISNKKSNDVEMDVNLIIDKELEDKNNYLHKQSKSNDRLSKRNSGSVSLVQIKQEKDIDLELDEGDYFDHDDDNDIDYQPTSQELKEDIESDNGASNEDDEIEDLELKARLNSDSQDIALPVINRPRSIRYRELKQQQCYPSESEKPSAEQKKETGDVIARRDAELARLMQQEFDREYKSKHKQITEVDDEYIARELQDMFDNEVAGQGHQTVNENDNENTPFIEKNNALQANIQTAKTLDLNMNLTHHSVVHKEVTLGTVNKTKVVEGVKHLDNESRLGQVGVRELQRRELEKIARWRHTIEADARLARQMQDMDPDDQEVVIDDDSVRPGKGPSSSVDTTEQSLSFRQIVAQHRASRDKALSQLEEYRHLQSERFRHGHDQAPVLNLDDHQAQVGRTGGQALMGNADFGAFRPDLRLVSAPTDTNDVIVVDDQPFQSFERQHSHLNNLPTRSTYRPNIEESTQLKSQSNSDGDHMAMADGQKTQIDQSQTETRNSNIKCGNCGQKGHNRTFVKCPSYHTAEETARREAKVEKIRQQKDMKRKEQQETIEMLSSLKND
ncbi:hypothetical protein MAR_002397 [Mya arenaria]|uniref:Uncharacterized protein n=1 Tax=Mya arenaria TaxID=6604 RepID=A0ABY7FHB4_MYAAR|nr:hypothetical protein MAR_002397 [Mya arenaria]